MLGYYLLEVRATVYLLSGSSYSIS